MAAKRFCFYSRLWFYVRSRVLCGGDTSAKYFPLQS